MCVGTADNTKNIPMPKYHSDGAKAWKEILGLCVWTKKCKKKGTQVQDLKEEASTIIGVCGPARSLGLQVPRPEMGTLRPTTISTPRR